LRNKVIGFPRPLENCRTRLTRPMARSTPSGPFVSKPLFLDNVSPPPRPNGEPPTSFAPPNVFCGGPLPAVGCSPGPEKIWPLSMDFECAGESFGPEFPWSPEVGPKSWPLAPAPQKIVPGSPGLLGPPMGHEARPHPPPLGRELSLGPAGPFPEWNRVRAPRNLLFLPLITTSFLRPMKAPGGFWAPPFGPPLNTRFTPRKSKFCGDPAPGGPNFLPFVPVREKPGNLPSQLMLGPLSALCFPNKIRAVCPRELGNRMGFAGCWPRIETPTSFLCGTP